MKKGSQQNSIRSLLFTVSRSRAAVVGPRLGLDGGRSGEPGKRHRRAGAAGGRVWPRRRSSGDVGALRLGTGPKLEVDRVCERNGMRRLPGAKKDPPERLLDSPRGDEPWPFLATLYVGTKGRLEGNGSRVT